MHQIVEKSTVMSHKVSPGNSDSRLRGQRLSRLLNGNIMAMEIGSDCCGPLIGFCKVVG